MHEGLCTCLCVCVHGFGPTLSNLSTNGAPVPRPRSEHDVARHQSLTSEMPIAIGKSLRKSKGINLLSLNLFSLAANILPLAT